MTSPLIGMLRDQFSLCREFGKSAMFVYWDAWEDRVFTPAVDKGAYPWAVHDEVRRQNPNAQLCLAFDLKKSFEEQMPAGFEDLENLLCFSISPVVWIHDRAGKIPAREREEFVREALQPPRPVLSIIK
jgi:hypothetical protein